MLALKPMTNLPFDPEEVVGTRKNIDAFSVFGAVVVLAVIAVLLWGAYVERTIIDPSLNEKCSTTPSNT